MAEVKNRVVIHTLIFPPDQVSTAYLYGDITQKLIREGYQVIVLTTFPHYNFHSDFKKISKPGFLWRETDYFGANVFHFPQKKSRSFAIRGLNVIAFHLAVLLKGLFLKKVDFILTPSPPLTSGLIGGVIGKMKGAKVIYNVQEIYPDVFIKQGAVKNSFLIRLFKWMEKKTYQLSDKVVTIDEHFSKTISARLPENKLSCIPNFIDTELYKPFEESYPAELMFDQKFLVGYAGNLGKVQDWDAILKAADLLKEQPEFHFLIVGGGSEYQNLKDAERTRSNITVWPYQNREKIPAINSRINLHIISMNEASDYDGLPSKVFAILSSGRPILAATNFDTPLANLIRKSGNGVVVNRSDAAAMANAIIQIRDGLLTEETNRLGRKFVIDNYSKDVVTSRYISLLKELA